MIRNHHFNDRNLVYVVEHKKRKTLGIYIDLFGNVTLRVPKNTQESQITNLIESKWAWIHKTCQDMKEKSQGYKERTYAEGDSLLFLGEERIVNRVMEETSTLSIRLGPEGIQIRGPIVPEEEMKKAVKKFYKQQLKAILEERIQVYQKHFKVKPRGFKITDNKKTWGTCNSRYELTFNYRLMMAPIQVIDYLVIHEMAHMVHLNHDRSFWRLVGSLMRDYETCEAWLQESQYKMMV